MGVAMLFLCVLSRDYCAAGTRYRQSLKEDERIKRLTVLRSLPWFSF
jgi:hypothetical protein